MQVYGKISAFLSYFSTIIHIYDMDMKGLKYMRIFFERF